MRAVKVPFSVARHGALLVDTFTGRVLTVYAIDAYGFIVAFNPASGQHEQYTRAYLAQYTRPYRDILN